MGDWSLAIDFGTCFTCAAIRVGEQVEVLETDSGRYTPSLVYRDEHGRLLTGRLAASEAAASPANVARTPKRALAQRAPLLLGGSQVAAEDLVAAVLSTMAAEAFRRTGGLPPGEAVLTHPAAWDDQQIAALGEAAERAGLTTIRFVPEPVAAAAFYTQGEGVPTGAHVAVYDLGGGTFDIAVLRRTQTGFDVVAQSGSDRIGGEDFDEALYDLVAGHAMTLDPAAWQDFTQGTGPRAARDRTLLRRDITEAKELLSDTTIRKVIVGDLPISVTRAEFEAAIADDLRATIITFQDVVTGAGLTVEDLAAVYLTGGSSRIPLVSDLLSQLLGRTPNLAGDPKAVVALGALTRPQQPRPTEFETKRAGQHQRRASQPTPVLITCLATLTGHTGTITSVAFSPDGTTLATGSHDRTACLWDITFAYHPRRVAVLTDHHGGWISGLAFSPDGTTLASSSHDRTARLWDVTNPHHPKPLTIVTGPGDNEFTGHTGVVTDVAFSPDGTILATTSDDKTARLWDIRIHHSPTPLTTLSHTSRVLGVAFSPNGAILATTSSDGIVWLWDITNPHHPKPLTTLTDGTGWVYDVAFSPDGTTLATGHAKTAQLWNISTPHHPKPFSTLSGHTHGVGCVAFSPDGTTLTTASEDMTVRLWERRAVAEGRL